MNDRASASSTGNSSRITCTACRSASTRFNSPTRPSHGSGKGVIDSGPAPRQHNIGAKVRGDGFNAHTPTVRGDALAARVSIGIPTGNRMFITTEAAELKLFSGTAFISVDPTPLQTDQPGGTSRPTGSFSLLYMHGRLASARVVFGRSAMLQWRRVRAASRRYLRSF